MNESQIYTIIGIVAAVAIAFFVIIYSITYMIKTKLPKLWLVFRVKILRRRDLIQKNLKAEVEGAKQYNYETFEDFLRDAPKYQIETDFLARMIRQLYRAGGARFQQFVFIDKTSSEDKTAWLRRKDNLVIHEKGTYALPWKSEKEIVYYDQTDMRPLIDMTDEIDWRNQDAVADVVTAITNAHSMASMDGQRSQLSKYVLISMILTGITFVLILAMLYQADKAQKENIALLTQIANQTAQTVHNTGGIIIK